MPVFNWDLDQAKPEPGIQAQCPMWMAATEALDTAVASHGDPELAWTEVVCLGDACFPSFDNCTKCLWFSGF